MIALQCRICGEFMPGKTEDEMDDSAIIHLSSQHGIFYERTSTGIRKCQTQSDREQHDVGGRNDAVPSS